MVTIMISKNNLSPMSTNEEEYKLINIILDRKC